MVELIWENHGLVRRMTGFVTGHELDASARALQGDERLDRLRYIIHDFSGATDIAVTQDEIEFMAVRASVALRSNPAIRIAFVGNHAVVLALIEAFNTKTARARTVAMTSRLASELKLIWENSPKDLDALVFGIADNIEKSFASACKAAKIAELRFHDLRHTAITRMIEAGMQPAEVMRVSGHTTPAMLWRYLNANADTARRAADALDVLRNSKS